MAAGRAAEGGRAREKRNPLLQPCGEPRPRADVAHGSSVGSFWKGRHLGL